MWRPPPYLRSLPLVHAWRYRSLEGETLGWVARYDKDGKKQIIPFFKTEDGEAFYMGAQQKPRSLYGLHLLPKKPDAGVLIVEGEKCAAALHQLGLLAVSPPMGANSVSNVDFWPLNGRKKVCILPDNDDAGEHFTQEVDDIIAALDIPPIVRRLDLDGLPPKGDIVNYIQAHIDKWDGYGPIHHSARPGLRNLLLGALKTARPISSLVSPNPLEVFLDVPTDIPMVRVKKQSLLEAVKRMVDIAPLVEEITPFTHKRGEWRHYICPFHAETESSFGCLKDYYHCFGCGASGDSISFVMKAHDCDFKGALKILADKLNIQEFI